MFLTLGQQLYEEECCRSDEDQEALQRGRQRKRNAEDDAFKDDFSSDEEADKKSDLTPRADAQRRPIGWFEAAELVFENSIRDNFQMQEATDQMRKIFDIGMKECTAL